MPTIELPPVTDAHRRAAFALFHWPDVSYEQAMRVDLRRRLIEACARVKPAVVTHAPAQDLKRLAAHDLDD